VAIFQHSLPFLQSESFQTQVGTIHRRAIGPLAHHNGTSAYIPSLTCTSPDDRMSSSSTVQTHVFLSHNFPDITAPARSPDPTVLSQSKTTEHVTMEINYCLFTLLHDSEARLSSIGTYLRKRNVVLSHCYNSANVIKPREPHTCNIIFKLIL
jgi:hypothetical protein